MILDADHCYDIYMLHRYYDPSHSYVIVMSHRYIYTCTTSRILVTDNMVTYTYHTSIHACIVSIFLSYDSLCILHRLLCHVTVFMLYDCFLLLIWIFPILDMRAVDMLYVDFHIYCSRFPLYCSCYIVPVSRYIVLCYQQNSGSVIMLPVSCTVVVLVTLYTWYNRS